MNKPPILIASFLGSMSLSLWGASTSADRQLSSCLAHIEGTDQGRCTVYLDHTDPEQAKVGQALMNLLDQGVTHYQVRLPRADPWERVVLISDADHYTITLRSAYDPKDVTASDRDHEFRFVIDKLLSL